MAKCIDCKYQGKWFTKEETQFMKCKAPYPPTTEPISGREALTDEPCNSYQVKAKKKWWQFWK